MNRKEVIANYVRVNRNFEVMFMPRVKRAIHSITKQTIADLKSGGFDKATHRLNGQVGNLQLAKSIETLYTTVGTRHARMTYSRLLHSQQKGFGFNAVWTKFITDYLKRFL